MLFLGPETPGNCNTYFRKLICNVSIIIGKKLKKEVILSSSSFLELVSLPGFPRADQEA